MTPHELKLRLARLPNQLRAGIQQEMVKQANRLADAQRARVHSDSGKTRASIKVTAGPLTSTKGQSLLHDVETPNGAVPVSFSLQSGNTTFANDIAVTVSAGGPETTTTSRAGSYDHAMAEEYGTRNMRARPFFWPAYRQMRPSIDKAISGAVAKALKAAE